jgi:glycosyltransferase involved in cell wall biosynthesis
MIKNPELAREMGRRARLLAKEKYSPAAHYKELMAIYENTINNE